MLAAFRSALKTIGAFDANNPLDGCAAAMRVEGDHDRIDHSGATNSGRPQLCGMHGLERAVLPIERVPPSVSQLPECHERRPRARRPPFWGTLWVANRYARWLNDVRRHP